MDKNELIVTSNADQLSQEDIDAIAEGVVDFLEASGRLPTVSERRAHLEEE